ncbi:MAG: amidase [Gammaproteobacteria bacterium]|jgi:amidase
MSNWKDATDMAALVRSGEAHPRDLVAESIEAIERLNPSLNAVITPLFDKARAAAEATLPDGPFRGVPMLVKDFVCHTKGDPFFEGMAYLKSLNWEEGEDTFLAQRFREAGFIFVGKTNTSELGMTPDTRPAAFGPTKNPWNTEFSPMGSSGGTAAGVASGMAPLGYGNDGGGSLRLPASACSLFGLKPSRGRVTHGPEYGDLFGGFVGEHVITRSVRDSAAVLDITSVRTPGEPYYAADISGSFLDAMAAPRRGLKVGIWATLDDCDVAPEVTAAVEKIGVLLEDLGHHVEYSQPAALGQARIRASFMAHYAAGTAWVLDHYWPRRTGRPVTQSDVESTTWGLAEMGRKASASDYMAAREDVQLFARDVASWWTGGFDLLLSPTMAQLPPKADVPAPLTSMGFAMPFNATGQPAASIPADWTASGMPVGVQLVAELGREDLLLCVARQIEEALDWAARTPPGC